MKKIKLLVAALLLVSCSKDNSNEAEGGNNQFVYPKKIVRTYTQNDYENGKEVTNNYKSEEQYEIQDDKVLSSIYTLFKNTKKEKATKTIYFYENELPKSLITNELESGKQIEKITFNYQAGKLVERIEEQSNTDNSVEMETTTYTYDGDKLVKIEEKSENSKVTREFTYLSDNEIKENKYWHIINGPSPRNITTIHTLDAQKRLIKSVIDDGRPKKMIYEYQYDDKKNFSHTPSDLKAFPDHFVNATQMKNNLLHEKWFTDDKKVIKTTQYTYQYNRKGYPVRIMEKTTNSDSSSQTRMTELTY